MNASIKTIISTIFIAACLSAWADSNSETILAGPCVHLRNPQNCINYPTGECFWDEADQRCENRYNNEDSCSEIDYISECIQSQLDCFWDYDDQRCERRE